MDLQPLCWGLSAVSLHGLPRVHRKAVYKAAFILVVKTTEQSAATMFNIEIWRS